MNAPLTGPVRVVGTGLIGTSIGLALRQRGVAVQLHDSRPAALYLAADLGAGVIAGESQPQVVVVATPPDVVVSAVLDALEAFPNATVMDVASVKRRIEEEIVRARPEEANRYVGSHPMAGREKSGPAAADADLFHGRTWVLCPRTESRPKRTALEVARRVALACGGIPHEMGAREHDEAVAAVSHLPQVMASLTAARLTHCEPEALGLSGQGLRDVTRIAASDPTMWAAILAENAAAVLGQVEAIHAATAGLLAALRDAAHCGMAGPGVMKALAELVARGREGAARIPGKHGGAPRRYSELEVLVPDRPGELGRLFIETGRAEVNIEDLRLEHSAGAKLGVATMAVIPAQVDRLVEHLGSTGWSVRVL